MQRIVVISAPNVWIYSIILIQMTNCAVCRYRNNTGGHCPNCADIVLITSALLYGYNTNDHCPNCVDIILMTTALILC
jgi:hypothetical protein